jgi:hypothetical protein
MLISNRIQNKENTLFLQSPKWQPFVPIVNGLKTNTLFLQIITKEIKTICPNSITYKENHSIPTRCHQNGCTTCPNNTLNKKKPYTSHIIIKVTESSAPVISHMFNSQWQETRAVFTTTSMLRFFLHNHVTSGISGF